MDDDRTVRKIAQLEKRVANLQTNQQRLEWRSVSDEGLYAAGWEDADGFTPLDFAITRTGHVVFRGVCQKPAGSSTIETMFTLPEGFWPTYGMHLAALRYRVSPASLVLTNIRAEDDGRIQTGNTLTDNYVVFFDGVEYMIHGT